jgi:hypothetical protein
MGANDGDIMEQTEIINSVRVEETNPDRLKLAEKVLICASQCMEMEIGIEHSDKKAKLEAKALKLLKKIEDDPEKKPEGGQYL